MLLWDVGWFMDQGAAFLLCVAGELGTWGYGAVIVGVLSPVPGLKSLTDPIR